jgi:uncharacterized membrane protein
MTNEKAKATQTYVRKFDWQTRRKYWAYFNPIFVWAAENGKKPIQLAKEIGIPNITIYKAIAALNEGNNQEVRERQALKLEDYANQKSIQL